MGRARVWTAARVLGVIVLAAAAFAGGYAATRAGRPAPSTPRTPPPPAAYRAAAARPPAAPPAPASALPSASAVGRALAGLVTAPGLGRGVLARVVDVPSGRVLYQRDAGATGAPASTAKLLTAAALLSVRPATARIRTSVVAGAGGRIVLVGGGDPTLSGAPAARPTPYPGAARISDLAAQVRRTGVQPTGVVVDDSLFSGPAVSPAWAPEDVPSDYASAITAVMTDGGRAAPTAAVRSAAPDLAAGRELAAAMGLPHLPVMRGRAPAGARVLAEVSSAPLGMLVEQMLQQSDNVIAECLARQVALAEHRPASFLGSAQAVRAALRTMGLDPGSGMVDGSGLAARDRLSPVTLTGVVRLIAGNTRPALHAILGAVPVAAWSGTLADRFVGSATAAGAGVVRAKTGTLTGVSTLAGTVHDRDGRLLAFAFLAEHVRSTPAAEAALDALASRLARCGCG